VNVRGLDAAVGEPLGMDGRERFQQALHQLQLGAQRSSILAPGGQRFSLHELARQEWTSLLDPEVLEQRQVVLVQCLQGARGLQEAFGVPSGCKHANRQAVIFPVTAQVDGAARAVAQHAHDLVHADLGEGHAGSRPGSEARPVAGGKAAAPTLNAVEG
jgi:hypothetical protein